MYTLGREALHSNRCLWWIEVLLLQISILILFNLSVICENTNFTFENGFTSTDQLILVDDATYNRSDYSVSLDSSSAENKVEFSCGMSLFNHSVRLRDSSNASTNPVASFSTAFTFSIHGLQGENWGDGFAFTFRPDNKTEGSAGEDLCLVNSTGSYMFAIEFDTFKNSYDPSNNHIGVDLSGMNSTATYNLCGNQVTNCTYLVNQGDFTAWINYDSLTQIIQVHFNNGSIRNGVVKPDAAVISLSVDLNDILDDYMYVGFSGATGLAFEINTIKSWTFTSAFILASPSPGVQVSTNKSLVLGLSIPLSVLALVALGTGVAAVQRLLKQSAALRTVEQELARQQVQPCLYSYNDIKLATRDFHISNKLGEGGFGIVYKGTLSDGTEIAAKKLLKSRRVAEDFMNEVLLITGIRHRNLVKLRGCCIKDKQQILVYEYVENKNLAQALWGRGSEEGILDWSTRMKICEGIARGLSYLHEDSQPRIIHRDIKATNVLLDKDWKAKIADFGLARLFPDEQSHLSTMHIAGTMGYMAPEYATRGQLTDKADVYSFGVLLLEVVSGRKNIDYRLSEHEVYLIEWAWTCYESGCLLDLVDNKLSLEQVPVQEVHRAIMVAMFCIQPRPNRRPSMSSVLPMLHGQEILELVMQLPSVSSGDHAPLLAHIKNGIKTVSPFPSSSVSELAPHNLLPDETVSNVLEVSNLQAR